jgi:hypothetical protein
MRLLPCLLLAQLAPAVPAETLRTTDWAVTMDPETLAASARLPDGTELTLSTPGPREAAGAVERQGERILWSWGDSRVEALLEGRTLTVRFRRASAGRVRWPSLPAAGRGLSLPVLGQDHGRLVLSVLFANPFNNTLTFEPEARGTAIAATHEFTRLDPGRPHEVRISLDEADWLAPARRYREWLVAGGAFVPLREKLAAAADGARLVGASHAYLWGSRVIVPQDVRDWPALARLVPAPWRLRREAEAALAATDLRTDRYRQRVVIEALNDALEREAPGDDAASYRARKALAVRTLGPALVDPARWGDASAKAVEALQAASLPRMWLGLPQWEAGFASPEGVAAARRAGYLIGPYDSYDTALPPGHGNTDWSSARLGRDAFERCGIVLASGGRKAGFQGAGVYTNPSCVRPLLEERVRRIQDATGYNSWFLDVAGSGMAFDDYDPAKPTPMAQDVANRVESMAWIARTLGVAVGSEDGHAVANRPIAFAHGLQTRGFGWRDPDLRTNAASPHFLGRWYPPFQPEVFFRPAAIKPEYAALYFDPARRLPLFQAAFHDSVITTHHWTLDSLKFTETRATTELLQQLYNVPPLVNLSLDTMSARLPVLRRLDAFFRPLHERLWDQALTGFRWLDDAGLVQETRFADGTRILANFGREAVTREGHRLAGRSALALLPDGERLDFAADLASNPGR